MGHSWAGGPFFFFSSTLAASSSFLLTDRSGPGVSLCGIRCGGAGSGAAEGRACGRVGSMARVRVRTPEGCPGKSLNGLAATRTRHRGGGHARRGRGVGMARLGVRARSALTGTRRGGDSAWPRGAGAHARARGLASQSRGVAVPCAGHRHPGPAARRGGGRATAAAGEDCGASGSCTKDGTAAGRERVPRVCYGRLLGIAGSREGREGAAAAILTGGAEGGKRSVRLRGDAVARRCRAGQRGFAGVDDRGAGSVKLRGVASFFSSRGSCSSSASPSLSGVATAEGKRGTGV
jgi:hypothetical protein